MRCVFVSALLLLLPACAAPPRRGDASIRVSPVRAEHFSAPALRVHVLSVNGARVPPKALRRALATIQRHVGLPLEVYDAGATDLPERENGDLAAGIVWPVEPYGVGRLSEGDPGLKVGEPVFFDDPRGGIRGVISRGDQFAVPRTHPIIEPGVVLVAAVPGARDGSGVTGYASAVPTGDGLHFRTGMVVGRSRAIRARANFIVSQDNLWQWTLTHEIGHVLGVPGHNSHVWAVPGLGPHCTRPECVMYTGVDWRIVVTGLLRGWPMDFCRDCAEEMAGARAAARGEATSSSPGATGTP